MRGGGLTFGVGDHDQLLQDGHLARGRFRLEQRIRRIPLLARLGVHDHHAAHDQQLLQNLR